jgi:hypothetical protein
LIGAAFTAHSQQPPMKVDVAIVESVDDFQRWLDQNPALQSPYPSRLREVAAGKRVHFPIVVSGLQPPQKGEVSLVADAEFIAPDGRSLWNARQCCRFTITNRPDIRNAVLSPMANMEFGPRDVKGVYTLRVSVTDGSQTVATSEQLRFGSDAASGSSGASPATTPRLQMGAQPAKNPGGDLDKRDCLALATPAEVIKCTEKKK